MKTQTICEIREALLQEAESYENASKPANAAETAAR
jgi:hypothetical protein